MELVNSFRNKLGLEFHYTRIKNTLDLLKFVYHEGYNVVSEKIKFVFRQNKHSSIKINIAIQIELKKYKDEEVIRIEPWFSSNRIILYNKRDVKNKLRYGFQEILSHFDSFLKLGSGWIFSKIIKLCLHVAHFNPLRGGANCHYNLLPREIRTKKAVISIDCQSTSECFVFAILAKLYPRKNQRNIQKYYEKYKDCLNCANLSFPTYVKQINLFEKRNSLNINVYGFNKHPYIIYHSKNEVDESRYVDLLLFKQHYYLITNLSRLVGVSLNKTHKKKFICRSCLCSYGSNKKFREHILFCSQNGITFKMPTLDNDTIEFKHYRYQIMSDYVIYFDLECVLVPKSDSETIHAQHIPIAVGAIRICQSNPDYNSKLFIYVGKDCISQFVQFILRQRDEISDIYLHEYHPLIKTNIDKRNYENQKRCQMCSTKFSRCNKKTLDHDHLSGKSRFILCNDCNLTFAGRNNTIPVFAHYGNKYDYHHLICELARVAKEEELIMKVLPKSSEQNIQITFGNVVFKDSYSFLSASLSKLVETNNKNPAVFKNLSKFAGSMENFEMLATKGVFPYEYLSDETVLNERVLPNKDAFYDHLNKRHIQDSEYEYAKNVWKRFNCRSIKDYLILYLSTDVLLLADIFENYRKVMYKTFSLDPAHYLSTAHFSFNSMLKFTKVKLELIKDIDQYNFISKNIRGGISSINTRYAEANDPLLPNYNSNLPNSSIIMLDAVNLYGFSLKQALPIGGYKWVSDNINDFDVDSIPDYGKYGYIIECDLSYPDSLHDKHSQYPLCPTKMKVTSEYYSPYMKHIAAKFGITTKGVAEKLIPHVGDKSHYVLHFRNLKLYTKLGLKITKIHRILKFRQKKWLKGFIEFITELRKQAKNDFEINFWKSMINAIYGKLLQNPMKYINFKVVNSTKRFNQLSQKPTFKSLSIYSKHLAGIHLHPSQIFLNKPIIAGFTCLELSKQRMFSFHYLFIDKLFEDRYKLLMTDTDSLCYHIQTDNQRIEDIIYENRKYFDLSNYPRENKCFNERNKKKPGTFKNEHPKDPIIRFVGLRSKLYAFVKASNTNEKKAKGISRVVLKDRNFDDYLEALKGDIPSKYGFQSIVSKKHKVCTMNQLKVALSCFDDKRYILNNGVDTLSFFHYKLMDLKENENN